MGNAGLPLGELAPLVFMMMGPIGAMSVLAGVAQGAGPELRRQMAVRATLAATAAILLAVLLGAAVLSAWGVSPGALIVAVGLLLGLSSLRALMAQGAPLEAAAHAPSLAAAVSPVAIPTIASPYGIGVLIIFTTFFPAPTDRLTILATTLVIMGMNYLAMLYAHRIMATIGSAPLIVLGTVFGVLQLALGLEMIADGAARLF